MKFSLFFIDRPIFAIVISVITVVLGGIAYFILPVEQFPTIAPPTVVVQAQFPGADPKTLAETVAEPIEQQVNGVENMLYMSSTSSADGTMQLTVTFKLGTDPNIDQVLSTEGRLVTPAQFSQIVLKHGDNGQLLARCQSSG